MTPTSPDDRSLFSGRSTWVNGPVIVGAGPAGLAVAACLRARGVPFVVLERSDCIASLWQRRTYDRLKLHLPKRFCELPLLPFPPHFPQYPSRDQFVSYLSSYARRFDINPVFNQRVLSAGYDHTCGLWRLRTAAEVEYISQFLVVATGENAECVVPEMEGMGEFQGEMLHASDYKSGEAYRGKKVMVVGCGNSGMEVCLDLCHHGASPSMVVRDSVHVLPREVLGKSTFELAVAMMAWLPLRLVDKVLLVLAWLVLGSMKRYGLSRPRLGPMQLKNAQGKTPVLDIGALAKIESGEIEVVPAVERFTPDGAHFVDGRVRGFDAVVFATGYRSNVPSWLQEPEFFAKNGFPNGWKGKSGLYAAGFTMRGLSGLSIDARKIAGDIGRAWKEETRQAKRMVATHRRCISVFY